MKVKYFEDTDTLYIRLSNSEPYETREFNENIMLEVDSDGKLIGLTIEHAKQTEGSMDFSYETHTGITTKSTETAPFGRSSSS